MQHGASSSGSGGRCRQAGCECGAFQSQFYRPAMCVNCYHAVNVHFDGWEAVSEGGMVKYVNASTGQVLASRATTTAVAAGAANSVLHAAERISGVSVAAVASMWDSVAAAASGQRAARQALPPPRASEEITVVHEAELVSGGAEAGPGTYSAVPASDDALAAPSPLTSPTPLATPAVSEPLAESFEAVEESDLSVDVMPAAPTSPSQTLAVYQASEEYAAMQDQMILAAEGVIPDAKGEEVQHESEDGAVPVQHASAKGPLPDASATGTAAAPAPRVIKGKGVMVEISSLPPSWPITAAMHCTVLGKTPITMHVIVTNKTLMILEAHACKLGVGLLFFERSRCRVQTCDVSDSTLDIAFREETKASVGDLMLLRRGLKPGKVCSGWLYKKKRSGLGIGWKKRFFRLSESELVQYDTDNSATPKDLMQLSSFNRVAFMAEKPYGFLIDTDETTHYFAAESDESCLSWVQMISLHMQFLRLTKPISLILELPSPAAAQQLRDQIVTPVAQSMRRWLILDENELERGPYSETDMCSFILKQMIDGNTLVRPVAGPHEATYPLYVPISSLFASPYMAFLGNNDWQPKYWRVLEYQNLANQAMRMGYDSTQVVERVYAMQQCQLPAEMEIFLQLRDAAAFMDAERGDDEIHK